MTLYPADLASEGGLLKCECSENGLERGLFCVTRGRGSVHDAVPCGFGLKGGLFVFGISKIGIQV